jgi:protein-tyrosine phosphatase
MDIVVKGLRNFRSLKGMPSRDGRRVAAHTLLRSGQLHALDEADSEVLRRLGLRTVCDLRSAQERARYPNCLPAEGPRQLQMPVLADLRSDPQFALLLREAPNAAGATRTMLTIYRRLPIAIASHLPTLFSVLRSGEVPVLVHCAAGKDRTGFAVAVVLHALGVAPDDIMTDYLLSSPDQGPEDAERRDHLDRLTREAVGGNCTPEMANVLLDARPEFLDAAYVAINETYGSMGRYLDAVAGLDALALAKLRDTFLS